MKPILVTLFVIIGGSVFSQKGKNVYKNPADSSFHCYQVLLPESQQVKGVIVRDYSSLPNLQPNPDYPFKWKKMALENDLAILYTVSSNYFPELCYDDANLILMDEMIHEVVQEYAIPAQNIFVGGISSSGTRALKYAQFCQEGKSKFGIEVKGVFSVDSPLDCERFYYSALINRINFKAGMLWEANLMLKVFPERFNGTPENQLEAYRERSVFSYKDSLGGNAPLLMNTALLLIHEPDIEWWLEERGSSYYDINSFDISGLYACLKQNGHKDLEMLMTTGKGFDRKGNRNCHSWTIVDEAYLIDWILKRID